MLELYPFQQRAVAQIGERFAAYWSNRPGRVLGSRVSFLPFFQALASITASGKTVMMAGAVSELLGLLPVRPIVIWISKGRVVVDQTYANLQDGGKYRHLLADYDVRLLGDYDPSEIADSTQALVYLATVGTFNQRGRDQSNLRLFRSDIDNAEASTWSSLKERLTEDGFRRPLLVVYDEAHNLTDQQTDLLMELEPDALLLASATPRLPRSIVRVISELKSALGWTDWHLTTYVSSGDVVDAGLVKRQILLGGYQAQMEETIDDLLADWRDANAAASELGLSLRPKVIYVCRTNIVEGNAYQRDNPRRPFLQREAPPIQIWRHLVEAREIDPSTIAVYTSALRFETAFPAPTEFVHFRGGDSDYQDFISGGFRHVIFNLGLQEGWDDPECYFAYIDKSMQSNVQVEQVIGRVLRQPNAASIASERLNTAHFYVRVDRRGVFSEIVRDVSARLGGELPEVRVAAFEAGSGRDPRRVGPVESLQVPQIYRDPSQAMEHVDRVIRNVVDFRGMSGDNVRGRGAKALVQQAIGSGAAAVLEWVEREHSNPVSARWIFQTAVRRQFPLALEITRSDDPKFDALVELGSPADEHLRNAADEIVRAYLAHVALKQRLQHPYIVGDVLVDPASETRFQNAAHASYSGLNRTLELPFARELDSLGITWCRNPSRSGYGIPLLTVGQSRTFYPDFLAWKDNDVYALDTKGEHILEGELGRKLLAIAPHPEARSRLFVRFVSPGEWSSLSVREGSGGYTVWALGSGNALQARTVATMREAIETALAPDA